MFPSYLLRYLDAKAWHKGVTKGEERKCALQEGINSCSSGPQEYEPCADFIEERFEVRFRYYSNRILLKGIYLHLRN